MKEHQPFTEILCKGNPQNTTLCNEYNEGNLIFNLLKKGESVTAENVNQQKLRMRLNRLIIQNEVVRKYIIRATNEKGNYMVYRII